MGQCSSGCRQDTGNDINSAETGLLLLTEQTRASAPGTGFRCVCPTGSSSARLTARALTPQARALKAWLPMGHAAAGRTTPPLVHVFPPYARAVPTAKLSLFFHPSRLGCCHPQKQQNDNR